MQTQGQHVLCLAVTLVLLWIQYAGAADQTAAKSYAEICQERITQQAVALETSRKVLESKPAADWADTEIDTYLTSAFWLICYGMYYYIYEEYHVPESLDEYADERYFPSWPGNPLRDWQPIRILALADGFSAGDFVLQVCPPEYYSGLADPKPRSFVLGGYGRSIDGASPSQYDPTERNPWAVIPEGLLALSGMYTETYQSSRRKWAKRKQQEKAEDIQN